MSEKVLEHVLALAFRWHLHEAEAGKVAVTRAPGCGRISVVDKDGKTQSRSRTGATSGPVD